MIRRGSVSGAENDPMRICIGGDTDTDIGFKHSNKNIVMYVLFFDHFYATMTLKLCLFVNYIEVWYTIYIPAFLCT